MYTHLKNCELLKEYESIWNSQTKPVFAVMMKMPASATLQLIDGFFDVTTVEHNGSESDTRWQDQLSIYFHGGSLAMRKSKIEPGHLNPEVTSSVLHILVLNMLTFLRYSRS